MSRFDPPEPAPAPKRKNDESLQGGPFKMNRFGHGATQTTALSAIPNTRRHPDDALISNPQDAALPRRRPGHQSQ